MSRHQPPANKLLAATIAALVAGMAVNAVAAPKKKEKTIAVLYDYWILGKNAVPKSPRWSVLRNVLHWVQ